MKISVSNFMGTIEVRRGSAADPSVVVSNGAPWESLGFAVVESPDEIRISMAPRTGNLNCVSQNGRTFVQVDGAAPVDLDALPRVIVHAPAPADVEMSMLAGSASLGDIASFDGDIAGCVRLQAGRIEHSVRLSMASGAEAELAAARALDLRGAGGARAALGELAGHSRVELSGGARLNATQIDGSLTVRQDDASRVAIGTGNLASLDLETLRASRFQFGGVADLVQLSIGDASRVEIAKARQPVNVTSRGRAARLSVGGEPVTG